MARTLDIGQGGNAGGSERGPEQRWLAHALADLTSLAEEAPGRVRLHTVTMTRWVAVVGQLFTILFVDLALGITLPLVSHGGSSLLINLLALGVLLNISQHATADAGAATPVPQPRWSAGTA